METKGVTSVALNKGPFASWQLTEIGKIRRAFKGNGSIKVKLGTYITDNPNMWVVDFNGIKGLAKTPSNKNLQIPDLHGRVLSAKVIGIDENPFSFRVELELPPDLDGLLESIEDIKLHIHGNAPWKEKAVQRLLLFVEADYYLGAAYLLKAIYNSSRVVLEEKNGHPLKSEYLVIHEDLAQIISILGEGELLNLIPKIRLYFTGNFVFELLKLLNI